MDNTYLRFEEVDLDLHSLIDEAAETIYPDFRSADEIAIQLLNVLGYFGATAYLRYLRGRIVVRYSWHPQNYFVAIRVRFVTDIHGAEDSRNE